MIPISTNNQLRARPTANYILIILNIIVFIFQYSGLFTVAQSRMYYLQPAYPQLFQFITYAFLHANLSHILGNMFFLFIFGNNVNDRLGNTGYTLLYLAGAIFSGLGHMISEGAGAPPVLGASGAVAAVTGAYMVLYPKTTITVLNLFIIIMTFNIPAVWFIALKLIVIDNIITPKAGSGSNVAYGAHLAGYIFGFVVPFTLLALKLLPHSHFDLWSLLKRWNRRQSFTTTNNTRPTYNHTYSDDGRTVVQSTAKNIPPENKENPNASQIAKLKSDIAEAFYANDLNKAAEQYQVLLRIDDKAVLPQQQQLDISNTLMQMQAYTPAALAYEAFIVQYSQYTFIEQIYLMLGLIYSRYLPEPTRAKKLLLLAHDKLTEEKQKQLCQTELQKLGHQF